MNSFKSNIETVARDICFKQLSDVGFSGEFLATDVDRYWHCVAAQLEAGQIDELGNTVRSSHPEKRLAAYRDWCQRHPKQ